MRQFALTFFLFALFLGKASDVQAVCPVCTIAVGAGLGLSRFLGIDDTISGLWVGGLILSSTFWLVDWLKKRGVKIKTLPLTILTAVIFYTLTLIPLWQTQIIGHPFNTIFGIDKLLFGTVVGSVLFLAAVRTDKIVRRLRGKQLFVYQKVIFPFLSLISASLIFYLIIK